MDDIEKDLLIGQAHILYALLMNLAIEAFFNLLKSLVAEDEELIEIN